MFILSNIYDKKHRKEYPDIEDIIFDITKKQLDNKKNEDWFKIKKGSIVCIVGSSRKISTIYKVVQVLETKYIFEGRGSVFALTGHVFAKAEKELPIENVLNKRGFEHPYLPNNKFSSGFNVLDIGDTLNDLRVKTRSGLNVLGDLV